MAWVSFAGLPSSPYYDLAQKYTNGRPSALLTFGVKGGFDAGVKFYDSLKLFKRLVNIGDAKSLAAHPASTTHRQLSEAGAGGSRGHSGHDSPLRRHRAHRRYSGRFGAGAGGVAGVACSSWPRAICSN